MTIEILALMDRSGSMTGIMEEAVGAFNNFIQTQRDLGTNDEVQVTLATFDDRYEVVLDKVPLEEVPDLTINEVMPRGMTALRDSMAKLIGSAEGNDVVLLVQTDGHDNMSQEMTPNAIKELVKAKEKAGWDVNFIGAGIDAFGTSEHLGFSSLKSYTVDASARGMQNFGSTMSANTSAYRVKKKAVT